MMAKRINNKSLLIQEDGFSLVEILLAIVISTIMIGFAFGMYLFGQRYFLSWQNDIRFHNELHTIAQGIAEEIYSADHILSIGQHEIVILKNDGREQKYKSGKGSLFKNEKSLLHPSLILTSFELKTNRKNGRSYKPTSLEDISEITLIEFTIEITDGKDTLGSMRSINLRKPSNWNSFHN
jgi:prepilin-type N-terminal cleavage/methylation domain-containing protein